MLIEQFKSKLSHYKYKIELGPVHWNWNSRSSRKLTSLRLQLMRRCRSRPQQIWYNVFGLYGSPLAFRVSNTKRHSQNCISERVSDPNSALNGFAPGKSLLFRLLAHCSHTLSSQSASWFSGEFHSRLLWPQLYSTLVSHTRAADVP